ncbi:hypothetical protein HY003_02725 [Candidatus Saccharibacteria bacterium]|nr:hypothetical protein [Candidatus Saccharibacteria bacterium]MBI3338188.1 hypothetical protein [Candidatus Saccharibacteria bacterium]
MHKQISNLFNKEMSRKEFLATTGLGLASILGFSSVIKLLSSKSNRANGYGSSPYGR